MTKILELPQLIKNNQMSEGQIRAGGVNPEFDAKWPITPESLFQIFLSDNGVRVGANGFN